MAVSYLKELGHARIGYLGGDMNSFISRERYQACVRAMELHGLDVDEALTGRIDHENRLIYNIDDNGSLWIISCKGHYNDK